MTDEQVKDQMVALIDLAEKLGRLVIQETTIANVGIGALLFAAGVLAKLVNMPDEQLDAGYRLIRRDLVNLGITPGFENKALQS